MTAWKAEGRAVTAEVPAKASGALCAAADRSRSSSTRRGCAAHLGTPGFHLIDGRAAVFYDGVEAGGPRKGHIPGARSVPFTEVTDETLQLKSPAELAALFSRRGRRAGRHGRRVLPHRPTGDGRAVRRAHARPSGAALRRLVPGVGRAAPICRSRTPPRRSGEAMSARASRRAGAPYADPYLAGVALGLVLLAAFVFAGRGLGRERRVRQRGGDGGARRVTGRGAEQRLLRRPSRRRRRCWRDWLVVELARRAASAAWLSATLAGRLRASGGARAAHRRRARLAIGRRRRRADGRRRGARARLHERTGAHRRRAAQRRELAVHAVRVRARRTSPRSLVRRAWTMTAPFLGVRRAALAAPRFASASRSAACLERAGLGSARKLVGQFYLTDLTVLQGDVQRDRHGDARRCSGSAGSACSTSSASTCRRRSSLPQLVGGCVFGVGFALAGLCPGTSCVAAATGRVDGARRGAAACSPACWAPARCCPRCSDSSRARARGAFTLPQLLGVSDGLVVLGRRRRSRSRGFAVAERDRAQRTGARGTHMTARSRARRRGGVLALAAAAVAGTRAATAPRAIDVAALAREIEREADHVDGDGARGWIRDRKPGLRVLDVRTDSEFEAYHIPSAERRAALALATMRAARRRDAGALLRRRRARRAGVGAAARARLPPRVLPARRSARLDGAT